MELTWYGLSCFRITERKHATVVTDPFGGGLWLAASQIKGGCGHREPRGEGPQQCRGRNLSRQHVVDGPGEYEMGGVFITGIATFDESKSSRNVLYVLDFNGLTVAHLGDMQQVPTQKQIEALEQVNILLVPVGAGKSLNAAQAAELVSMLEPNIVVPMHYQLPRSEAGTGNRRSLSERNGGDRCQRRGKLKSDSLWFTGRNRNRHFATKGLG